MPGNEIKKPKILLACASDYLADSLQKSLGNEADLVHVKNIPQARKALSDNTQKFDAIITQYFKTQDVNGIDLITELRPTSDIPILLFTNSDRHVVQNALDAGATKAADNLEGIPSFINDVSRKINAAQILLVDENKHYNDILERQGQKYLNAGFTRADTTEQAKHLVQENHYDVVIVSADTAFKNQGSELIGDIKSKNADATVAVITNPDYSHGAQGDLDRSAFLEKAQKNGAHIISVHEPKEIPKLYQEIAATHEGFAPGFKQRPYTGIQ